MDELETARVARFELGQDDASDITGASDIGKDSTSSEDIGNDESLEDENPQFHPAFIQGKNRRVSVSDRVAGVVDMEKKKTMGNLQRSEIRTMSIPGIGIVNRWKNAVWKLARGLTESRGFEVTMALFIMANAVYIGIEVDFGDDDQQIWYVSELFFFSVFLGELLLRMMSYSLMKFIRNRWNLFDTALVGWSVVELFFLSFSQAGSQGRSSSDVSNLLGILRILRVFRLLRLLRFLKTLYLLVVGVGDALRSLVWANLLIFLVIYVFGIVMTKTLGASQNAKLEEEFGTLGRSMFTLFQVMTLDDWPSVARNAMNEMPWIVMIFILFLLVTTFSIMNVITAVIVESTLESAMTRDADIVKQREQELKAATKKILEVFQHADVDGDHTLTKEEFVQSCGTLEVQRYLEEVGVDPNQAANLFDILDVNEDSSLEMSEFVNGMLRSRGQARAQDVLAVQCLLWRNEKTIRERLQELCKKVKNRMFLLDRKVDQLAEDLETLSRLLHSQSASSRARPSFTRRKSGNSNDKVNESSRARSGSRSGTGSKGAAFLERQDSGHAKCVSPKFQARASVVRAMKSSDDGFG